MSTILVTGGTGTLGRLTTVRLRAEGHEVRVLSRHAETYPVDLRTGDGLDAALDGVDTVVHCASAPRGDERAARQLVAAARRAGVGHLVYISIVGVDRVPLGYYGAKRAVERLVEESGLGFTLLRTTQFHDLVLRLLRGMARSPLMPVPAGVPVQPVEAEEVAARLSELAMGPPAGRVPEMGGPQILTFHDLAELYLWASGRSRVRVPFTLPGATFTALRRGGLLTPERRVGLRTFTEFLARSQVGSG
ncbi:SDR family oxidoreductase [Streptomyces purpureus]|uniref:SDR family oxidoreductase n=1 Tax=Streptomyces purpureus TaxID=1951 RepID=UPI00166FE52E|nr:NAD(P)H-binding protein [Streptomyces purpureus]